MTQKIITISNQSGVTLFQGTLEQYRALNGPDHTFETIVDMCLYEKYNFSLRHVTV